MESILGDGAGCGGGRFFGGGERRLRPHNHQALKCPRCDSLNTKFCYYNNYNLSQPRHFCKSCRRYWTKGGVLRNVPVGGGCRKNKRSKAKASAAETPAEGKSRNKSDSSESSSLTAAAAAETAAPKTIPVSAEEVSASNNSSSVRDFPDARLFDVNPEANQSFGNHDPSAGGEIFPTEIGGFASLMTTSEEAAMGFGGIGDIPMTASFERAVEPANQAPVVENRVQATAAEEFKMEEGLAAALDWGEGVDQGQFDLTAGVDQGRFDLTAGIDPADWSQHQWTVNDQSLHYFPYI